VLGNNLDLGGDGSRNGTGKTTIINALSYSLYGLALYNIKKDNLINKTNGKHMVVTVEFEKDGVEYRVERGRSPRFFRFYVQNQQSGDEATDEQQGEGRETQKVIDRLLGMSHDMFKHIVALNTYTEPFLSMKNNDQRDIIEQLLGITMLTEKAERLKEQQKTVRDSIKEEEIKISAVKEANERFEKSIADMERRQRMWIKKRDDDIVDIEKEISVMELLDIDQEVAKHSELEDWNTNNNKLTETQRWLDNIVRDFKKYDKTVNKLEKEIELLKDHKCHACGQDLHDDSQEQILRNKEEQLGEARSNLLDNQAQQKEHNDVIANIGTLGQMPVTHYNTLAEALQHQNTLTTLRAEVTKLQDSVDPYSEQIDQMRNEGLQEVNWDTMNELVKVREHQDFLYKLLTNKDSFVRKRIIEQNLIFLNNRLGYYINQLGLPHDVMFQPDLEVSIQQLGQDLDFDNLSRGERNRLILSLSWAFRDVFESMNHPINFMAIDELIDSGMDSAGVDNALGVLKKTERERNKNILLISHKEELVGRVNNVLQVTKENGFTTFDVDVEAFDV
jgi:DNA repair exonuclease SbcCD ATPase subunit